MSHVETISGNKPTQTTPIAPILKGAPDLPVRSIFDELPDSAFIRQAQLIQNPKRPGIPAPLPFSGPTLWRMVKAGTFPKPVKLSKRVTGFQVGAVRAWMASQTAI